MEKELLVSGVGTASCQFILHHSLCYLSLSPPAIMKNNDDNIAPTTVSESRSDIEYCPTAQPTADEDDALYHHKSGRRAIRDGDIRLLILLLYHHRKSRALILSATSELLLIVRIVNNKLLTV